MPTPKQLRTADGYKYIKERIGLYGGPKIGKTHQYLTIARWHQELGSDAKFYAVNTDTSFEVLMTNPEFEPLTNVIWADAWTLQDAIDAGRKFTAQMRAKDWILSDLQSDMWKLTQDEAAAALTAKTTKAVDLGDLWAVTGPGDYPIEGWDWGIPNGRYRTWAQNILLRAPGHVMCIYAEKELMKESKSGKSDEDPRVRDMFKHIGAKPEGQKDDPFRWHTILHLESNGAKKQKIATAGERFGYRRWMGTAMQNGFVRAEPMNDFFLDYLVGVAGWSMEEQ